MKKSTKGALAAAASASLLLGGAGSLAYWNTTDDVTAGTFNTGDLSLSFTNCDAATWTVANDLEAGNNGPVTDLADFDVVPGDVFTKTCTIPITAIGDNLRAQLQITGGNDTPTAGLIETEDYTVTPSFKVGSTEAGAVTVTEITDADQGKNIYVKIVVDFPIRNGVFNNSKLDSLVLTDYTVTATQINS